MFIHIAADATSTTARFRMPALCSEWVSGAPITVGRIVSAQALGFGYVVDVPAPFKGAAEGVRAWRPPV